ncbi:hypothetical protein M8J75_011495 [Diaphorina citri]|nr:hypothetical protein M8J75_011495 [Diaphorina citri]
MIENHIKQVVTFSGYYPRPGIVLDDTEYKPAGHRRPHPPPIITAAPPTRVQGDIFDVTVSAIQGPGGEGNGTKTGQAFVYPVELEGGNSDVITTAQNGQHFVSIDGKRTYMNLFGGSGPAATQDVAVKPTPAGSYGLSPLQTQAPSAVAPSSPGATSPGGSGARPPAWRKPAHPPVRIDTCIVGDDTTCDVAQHERCRTEVGVSSCHCRPGYSRRKHREPCHRIVSIGMSLRMDSAMSMTPFSDIFMAARIHNIYPAKNNGLTLNMTLQLAENADTLRPPITGELSKHVQGVIHRRQNNVGNSALWVDNSPGVVSLVQDINECSSPELNDCSPAARCTNVFGSFQCTCPDILFYSIHILIYFIISIFFSILSIFMFYSILLRYQRMFLARTQRLFARGAMYQHINECSSPELNDCSPAARCTNVFGSFQCTCPDILFYSIHILIYFIISIFFSILSIFMFYSILLRYQRMFLARTQRLFARGAMYQRVRLLPMYLPGYSLLFYPYSILFIFYSTLFYSYSISVLFSDINECSSPELNDCSPAARCTNVFGSFQYINECSSPELNDCSPAARCTNVFGSFQCTCPEGTRDPWVGNLHQSGRTCESCDPSNCNHRGTCSYQTGQPVCKCSGSFYGAQCEIDGEVLGVAIGASVCALLIILVTLIRRWNREQKIGSPVFGYMPQGGSTVKTPAIGGPPYQVSLEDRLRWAQIADAMAHANHYAPVVGTMNSTRPSSAMFGYSLPHHPVPLPRLRPPASQLRTPESSTSEEEDRTDLLGRNFQVPRPKSRSSVANQSGIYYDVDYEQQNDVFSQKSHPSCIPLNTYTMGSRLARPSKLTRLARPSKLTRLARPSKLTRLARPSKLTRLARSQS